MTTYQPVCEVVHRSPEATFRGFLEDPIHRLDILEPDRFFVADQHLKTMGRHIFAGGHLVVGSEVVAANLVANLPRHTRVTDFIMRNILHRERKVWCFIEGFSEAQLQEQEEYRRAEALLYEEQQQYRQRKERLAHLYDRPEQPNPPFDQAS